MFSPRAARPALLVVLMTACAPSTRPSKMPACPPLHEADDARAHRVDTLLERVQVALPATTRMCFGPTAPSEVSVDGVMRLDVHLSDVDAAARAAHLALHMRAPVDVDQPCDAFVEATLRSEADALALELEVRRSLDALAPRSIEARAPPPAGNHAPLLGGLDMDVTPSRVLSWLRSHPAGGDGVRAVAADALAACHARVSRSRP